MNRISICVMTMFLWPITTGRAQDSLWASRFLDAGIVYPPYAIAIEVFKEPAVVNVWASDGTGAYSMIWQFPICRMSGTFGPKRKEGDLQVPEGVYHVDRLNPRGRFGRSFGINYPNKSDRILGDPRHPGGDIFFHGQCVSVGCVSLSDEESDQLYSIVLTMSRRGQVRVPVCIFPFPMSDEAMDVVREACDDSILLAFWENLKNIFDIWSAERIPPLVRIDSRGVYHPVRTERETMRN